MRLLLLSLGTCAVGLAAAPQASACPEVLLPIATADPVVRGATWKAALDHHRAGRFGPACATFRGTARRLEQDATKLFRPAAGRTVKNATIRRWLERYVTANPPSVTIVGDRFSFPVPVLWAWADCACRTGAPLEADLALRRLARVHRGGALSLTRALVAVRVGALDRALRLVGKAPPDPFLTPYIEALVAVAQKRPADAQDKLLRARLSADTPERRAAVDRVAATIPGSPR